MIILRDRTFSIWSHTLDWAKKFTPRIPIGNTNLYILWPGTLVGAMIGLFKGIRERDTWKVNVLYIT